MTRGFSFLEVIMVTALMGLITYSIVESMQRIAYARRVMESRYSYLSVTDGIYQRAGQILTDFLNGSAFPTTEDLDVGGIATMKYGSNFDGFVVDQNAPGRIKSDVQDAKTTCAKPCISTTCNPLVFCMWVTPKKSSNLGLSGLGFSSGNFSRVEKAFVQFSVVIRNARTFEVEDPSKFKDTQNGGRLADIQYRLYWTQRAPSGMPKITNSKARHYFLLPKPQGS